MNRLQSQFYVSFPVVQADYSMILLDLKSIQRLLKNARYIQYLRQRKPRLSPGSENSEILHSVEEFTYIDQNKSVSVNFKELDFLHLNAQIENREFVPLELDVPPKLYVLTEKFFWHWPTFNLGSGRHALLFDMQIKGVGRNPLAIRHDHSHSWGGHYLWQAFKGYIVGHIYEGAAPLGILKTPYIAAQNKDLSGPQIKTSANSMSIREADALRVTQVVTKFDPNEGKTSQEILKDFLKRNKIKNLDDHLDKIIFHYVVLLLMGIRHTAVTRENVTLEGRLIDYEDMRLDSDAERFRFFLMTHQCHQKVSPGFKRFKGQRLFASSVHFYLDAIKLTVIGLGQLDPSFKVSEPQLKRKLIQMIKKLRISVFDIDESLMEFIEVVLSHPAIYDKGEKRPSHEDTAAADIIKLMKKRNYEVNITQDMGSYDANYYFIDFPRVKFKNKFLDNYYLSSMGNIELITERIFKMLQLESFSGKLSFDQMLNFSSECNKVLSQYALAFPYKMRNGKVELDKTTIKKFEMKFSDQLKKDLGANLNSLDVFKIKNGKESVIRGASIRLKDGSPHYISLCPIYCST